MIIEHHPTKSDKLCFLYEEELFTLIVHVNKTILAAFITYLVRHPEKRKLNGEPTMYCSSDYSKLFLRHPVYSVAMYLQKRLLNIDQIHSKQAN